MQFTAEAVLKPGCMRGEVDGQTFNRYAYIIGDPIRYIDQLGLCEVIIDKLKNPFNRDKKTTNADDKGNVLALPAPGQSTFGQSERFVSKKVYESFIAGLYSLI